MKIISWVLVEKKKRTHGFRKLRLEEAVARKTEAFEGVEWGSAFRYPLYRHPRYTQGPEVYM